MSFPKKEVLVAPSTKKVRNAYPELPELKFARTSVPMKDVVAYLEKAAATAAIKRATYVIFRNESGSGEKGINNNYIGLQADGNRLANKWTSSFSGTCVRNENMTGKPRRFVCFKDWSTSIDILTERLNTRGLYVGGYARPYANMQVNSAEDWVLAYWREWVLGDSGAAIPKAEKAGLLKLYAVAEKTFP
jgi:hypothetical protein